MIHKIGQAYGTFLKEKGIDKALIGGDARLSTPLISRHLAEGLTSVGIDLIDIGTVATPVFYYGLHQFDLNGGAMITGSHK